MADEDLVQRIESMGVAVENWNIAKPWTNETEVGWEGSRWYESEENCNWVFETCVRIVEESQTDMEGLATRFDGRALARLGSMCSALTVGMDGGAALFKDMARVAWFASAAQGELPFDLDAFLRMQMYKGRYLDITSYYSDQLAVSSFDHTFAPDIVEILVDLNNFYEEIRSKDQTQIDSEHIDRTWAMGHLLGIGQFISRGAFLQLEAGLGVLSFAMANQFITTIAPPHASIALQYVESESSLSPVQYITSHYMVAYSSLMLRNLTPMEIPDEYILESADNACMDGREISPLDSYHSLFGHIVRLRVLASIDSSGGRWEDAVDHAKRAVGRAESLAEYNEMHYRASSETIMSLIETGRIGDMKLYADEHSMRMAL